ncbi:MAG: PhoX family protein [Actinomycetota bacterium]|nr:PhoX family protein [Actinomycetota bacterium]
MTTIDRKTFLRRGAVAGGTLATMGPLSAYYAKSASGAPNAATGYGPLVNKGDLWLPVEFNYQVLSRQGQPMSDGQPTPGVFDGMGAFPGRGGNTILIRNHENRERAGEQKVITGPAFEYDVLAFGGNTKLEVSKTKTGKDAAGNQQYAYEVVRDFAILGGTSTNCAGGLRSPHSWLTCEEVVKRTANGTKHGYIFEIDARADGPVRAIPVPKAGRRAHEAAIERSGIIYMTEDRSKSPDLLRGQIGAALYRYTPSPRGGGIPLHETSGPVEALAIKGEPNKDMDLTTTVGASYPVEWVPIPEPDHEDDSDNRRDRVPGFTPNRVQAADRGAAVFSRQEGMWAGPGNAKVYFDCTSGGKARLGQVWEYDPGRELLTLIFESTDPAMLQSPDNVVIVPQTGDVFLQEDGAGDQFVRGVTRDGDIYDFAKTQTSNSEFCGACFDPDRQTLYLNQQGGRGNLPFGTPGDAGVTYAIYGPFEKRAGSNSRG